MKARIYLRASTTEQDAKRAETELNEFAEQHGLDVVGTFVENESGAKLDRPELFRLLSHSKPGDVLLIEQVDRLSRLKDDDWRKLRGEIETRQVRIVALDLPTSHRFAETTDDFTARVFDAINGLMLDILAAVARKDYEDRRRRQAQGIIKAKAAGAYRGRPIDTAQRAKIAKLLDAGMSWRDIADSLGCSKTTIAAVSRDRKADLFAPL